MEKANSWVDLGLRFFARQGSKEVKVLVKVFSTDGIWNLSCLRK